MTINTLRHKEQLQNGKGKKLRERQNVGASPSGSAAKPRLPSRSFFTFRSFVRSGVCLSRRAPARRLFQDRHTPNNHLGMYSLIAMIRYNYSNTKTNYFKIGKHITISLIKRAYNAL